ncbi:MAG: phospho-sugar mutase [Myxococcales bacterium]|nr:phospho-sugar mutase [Myxococcales bacterium]
MNERIAHYLKILDFLREVGEITPDTYHNASTWLTDPEYEEFQAGVLDLIRPTPLIDAFYQIIPFGTGGRRGTVGVGANRMNARTVGESAAGVAAYIKSLDRDGSLARRGVVVAHDVRLSSPEFTRITAEVIAAAGIKVYLFDGPRTTPLLSFAVRLLKTIAGVVVTASHNPPQDNGFKAYWEDGGQVVAPHDKAILEMVRQVKKLDRLDLDQAKAAGLVEVLDDRVDRAYLEMIRRDAIFCDERAATLVYSPLHGAGFTNVPPALKAAGFDAVQMPEAQTVPDGRFPTVVNNYPNPEVPAAMDAAVQLGRRIEADLVMASDPDADRLGIFVPKPDGTFAYLTGNQFQAVMLEFILARRQEQGRLPADAYVLTTLVTTKLLRAIAEKFGVEIVDHLLVGFKNIAAVIHEREEKGQPPHSLVFACEESIGYMVSPEVRDKDSGAAAVTAAQMAAYYKARGESLWERLQRVYATYGYFSDTSFSVFLEGEAGAEKMRKLMDALRDRPPAAIAGLSVTAVIDRQRDTEWRAATGEKKSLGLDRSNVLVFVLGDSGLDAVTVRPSGTEPKIKHYIAYHGDYAQRDAVDEKAAAIAADIKRIENEILAKI